MDSAKYLKVKTSSRQPQPGKGDKGEKYEKKGEKENGRKERILRNKKLDGK